MLYGRRSADAQLAVVTADELKLHRCLLQTDSLHRHIERLHVEYLQFAFRWMNNLLMREMPLHCVIRLWDTYLVSDLLILVSVKPTFFFRYYSRWCRVP